MENTTGIQTSSSFLPGRESWPRGVRSWSWAPMPPAQAMLDKPYRL